MRQIARPVAYATVTLQLVPVGAFRTAEFARSAQTAHVPPPKSPMPCSLPGKSKEQKR